jgi:hypothetical protein
MAKFRIYLSSGDGNEVTKRGSFLFYGSESECAALVSKIECRAEAYQMNETASNLKKSAESVLGGHLRLEQVRMQHPSFKTKFISTNFASMNAIPVSSSLSVAEAETLFAACQPWNEGETPSTDKPSDVVVVLNVA